MMETRYHFATTAIARARERRVPITGPGNHLRSARDNRECARTGDDMNRDGAHPRRLRVSALAAVANPSYTRIDTWNLLDDACRQPRRGRPGRAGQDSRPGPGEATDGPHRRLRAVLAVSRVRRIWRRSAPTWRAFPRCGSPKRCRWRCGCWVNMATAQRFSTLPRRWPSRSWWRRPNSSSSTPCCSPTTSPPPRPTAWPKACATLRNPSDDVQFEILRGRQRRGRHHRGRAERRDPGRDHPPRPAAAVARPGAVDEHTAGAQRTQRRGGQRRRQPATGSNAASGSGSCGRTSTSICSPTSRSRRATTTGPTSTTARSTGSTTSPICTAR